MLYGSAMSSSRRKSVLSSRHISPFFGFTGRLASAPDFGGRHVSPSAVMVLGSYFFDRDHVRPQTRQVHMSLDIIDGLLRGGRYTTCIGGPEGEATERQLRRARDALAAAQPYRRRY